MKVLFTILLLVMPTALHAGIYQIHQETKEYWFEQFDKITSLHISHHGDLQSCAEANKIHHCHSFLKAGSDIEQIDDKGMTPFLTAVHYGSFEAAIYLVSQGANPEARDNRGWNAHHLIVANHPSTHIWWAHRLGVPVDQPDAKGWTPLFLAAASGQSRHLEMLLKLNADPNTQDFISGITALMIASWTGNDVAVALLFRLSNPDIELKDSNGNQALHFAADQENPMGFPVF